MATQEQMALFGEECWGTQQLIGWQILERDERTGSTEEVLEHIESYAGKLPATTVLIPVQVLYVPTTNFFLMPVLRENSDDEETD